jgi:hypothetical protein
MQDAESDRQMIDMMGRVTDAGRREVRVRVLGRRYLPETRQIDRPLPLSRLLSSCADAVAGGRGEALTQRWWWLW